MKLGSRVTKTDDGRTYSGVVEGFDTNRDDGRFFWVSWHKGYGSWQAEKELRAAPDLPDKAKE